MAAMGTETNPWIKITVGTLCYLLLTPVFYGDDTIAENNPLSGSQTLVSAAGVFELGFFRTSGNSSKYYIGTWYKQVSEQTIVWVANRDSPISDQHSSELKISSGNLILLTNGSKAPIWSTNLKSTGSESAEAVLQDDGNLILRDERNSTLWQSFDDPTHTWLPGSKLAFDKRNRKSQLLSSWKNTEDPSTGLFSLELDPNGTSQYVILWNRTEEYWTSGTWDAEHQIFSLVPEMRLNYIYNFSYVDNENESYFIYSVKDPSIISRFVMDVSGQIKQLTWLVNTEKWNLFWSQPRQQCEVYAYCGAFGSCNQNSLPFCNCLDGFDPTSQSVWDLNDYSKGCARTTQLNCGDRTARNDRDRFRLYPDMVLPEHGLPMKVQSSEECESACLSNCSCTAYAYGSDGCSIWIGEILNLKQLSNGDTRGKTLHVRLAASEFPSNSNKKMITGITVGSVVAVVALLCLVLVLWKQKRQKVGRTKTVEGSLVAFRYNDLQNATKNFSEKLGEGGFGSVFKGTLPDSSVIAVKKLESISQGEKQFRTEVSTIGTIQHVNLVRLRGFCAEGTRKLLVYDYMPNGSLNTHLFHEKDSKVLDWKTRYQIALGTARGLAYLHEKCRDCIIHCDVKPENILLDAEFCSKVADFGLAKLVGREFSRVITTMRGTRGYLAPEWISGVAITAKADVYSYGMMLFEVVSGRRNTKQSSDGKVNFFPTWAANKITEGEDILSMLDYRLEGNADREEVMKMCKVAFWCTQDDENHRPSMGQVAQILEGVLDVNMPPMPRSLQVFLDNQEHIMFFTESSSRQKSSTRSNASTSSSQTKTYFSSISNNSQG